MRIMLIDPPFYRFMGYYNRYFPLGLVFLGTVLREAGHEVVVYDADCNRDSTDVDYSRLPERYPSYVAGLNTPGHAAWDDLRSVLRAWQPELVGLSGFTPKFGAAARVAEISKADDPDRPVIIGGPHATLCPEEILHISPHIDAAVIGEGEATILELCKHFGGHRGKPPDAVAGVAFRANGSIARTPERRRTRTLDEFPLPARELLLGQATYTPEDMGLLMTSRGCPFACAYCAITVWGRRMAYRSVENVVTEMRRVKARYGTRQFAFKDDTFTLNRRRVVELCERLIAERLDVNWDCNTRVNLVDEPLLRLMRRAGCNEIKFGIESGSDRVLGILDKGITRDDARRMARLMRKVGLLWSGYFMMGLPGETAADVRQTLDFMYELQPNFAAIAVYEPFPKTAMFEDGVRRGLVAPEMTLDDYYTRIPSDLYVKDVGRRVDAMTPGEFQETERLAKAAFNRYNVGLGRLVSRARARSRTYLGQPSMIVSDFLKVRGLFAARRRALARGRARWASGPASS